MGRLDLPDVWRDEDETSTCSVCRRWNRGASAVFGAIVCGRASCLAQAKANLALFFTLRSDDPALD